MEDSKYGKFDTVVVKDISRFARNTVDLLQNIRTLKERNINTIFLTANMTSMGDSEFILTIFGALAQEESANLSKRVKFGKRINAEKGRVPPKIYGYDRVDNFTLRINDEEAKVVKEIYRLYADCGYGSSKVAQMLYSRGIKTKYGGEWNARGVRRILENPIYCGKYVNHKYAVKNFLTGERETLSPDQNYHHERPEWAIIPEDTFNKAQELIKNRSSGYIPTEEDKKARYSTKHIFSTMIKCEHCGRSFGRHKKKYKTGENYYWYCNTSNAYTAERCPNKITINEKKLLQQIKAYFSSLIKDKNAFIDEVLKDIKPRDTNSSEEEIKKLEVKLSTLKNKRERFQEMYADDLISKDELKARLTKINSDITEVQNELIEYKKQYNEEDISNACLAYREEIEKFLSLENVTNVDLRKIIDHISCRADGSVKIYIKDIKDMVS